MRPDELLNLLSPDGITPLADLWQNELVMECLFWVATALLTLALLIVRPRLFEKLERIGVWIAPRRGLAVAITIFSALALRAALLPLLPYPYPLVHDEFSYTLQAQTFAAGRLTNPTPAMWVHFETFHVNMRPTYQSMYPPLHAIPMAAAMLLHLHPWWGIWLTGGLMCGAICWMLQAWMPARWAFLGGIYCILRFTTFDYWMQSYYGGAMAALGGALVLGSLPRIKRGGGARQYVWLSLGLAILANTRPYEGLVFSLPALISLALWLIGRRRKIPLRPIAFVPALALLAVVGAGMAYYNWRGTGNPLLMPYVVNQETYHISRPFIWQSRYPVPHYNHQVMRTLYVVHELPDYLNRTRPEGLWTMMHLKLRVEYDYYILPLLLLFLFSIRGMLRSKRMRIIPVTFLLVWVSIFIEQWPPNAHYAAPFACVVVAIMLYGLRTVFVWKPKGLPVGPMLARAICAGLTFWMLVQTGSRMLNYYSVGPYRQMAGTVDRDRVENQLNQMDGKHLVLLHRNRSANGIFDWVYNEPDLNRAKIVWARDMGRDQNEDLIRAYPVRHVWFLDQDDGIMRLNAYNPDDPDLDPARILNVASNQPNGR